MGAYNHAPANLTDSLTPARYAPGMVLPYSSLAKEERAERNRRVWKMVLAAVLTLAAVAALYYGARRGGYDQGFEDGRKGHGPVGRYDWF